MQLATVVGRQFITLSVHFNVWHDGREAARRADLSASAETFRNSVAALYQRCR